MCIKCVLAAACDSPVLTRTSADLQALAEGVPYNFSVAWVTSS